MSSLIRPLALKAHTESARLRSRVRRLTSGTTFDHQTQSTAALDMVRDHSMLGRVRVRVLYELIRHCLAAEIPGDFVECGVWKGGAVGVMALANIDAGAPLRRLHLFDAFDDICEPDPLLDGDDALEEVRRITGRTDLAGRLVPLDGIYKHMGGPGTVEICRDLLTHRCGYPDDLLSFHVGWFQDTVPKSIEDGTPDAIALLRLDGDFYASTRVCLDGLFDRVSPGGVVVIDDYGAYEGCRRAVHDFLDHRGLRPFLHYVDDDCRYWIKA
jgi:O-methyltransferase